MIFPICLGTNVSQSPNIFTLVSFSVQPYPLQFCEPFAFSVVGILTDPDCLQEVQFYWIQNNEPYKQSYYSPQYCWPDENVKIQYESPGICNQVTEVGVCLIWLSGSVNCYQIPPN